MNLRGLALLSMTCLAIPFAVACAGETSPGSDGDGNGAFSGADAASTATPVATTTGRTQGQTQGQTTTTTTGQTQVTTTTTETTTLEIGNYDDPPYAAAAVQQSPVAQIGVGATSTSYAIACQLGTSGAIVPDATGHFSVQGTLEDVGSSVPPDAGVRGPTGGTYEGTVSGNTITFTFTPNSNGLAGAKPEGPYTVTFGADPVTYPVCT